MQVTSAQDALHVAMAKVQANDSRHSMTCMHQNADLTFDAVPCLTLGFSYCLCVKTLGSCSKHEEVSSIITGKCTHAELFSCRVNFHQHNRCI